MQKLTNYVIASRFSEPTQHLYALPTAHARIILRQG